MGQSQSVVKTDKDSITLGYRVLGIQPNSPATEANLVSAFDFIVAADGVHLKAPDDTIFDMIKESAAMRQPLPLTVYNWKSSSTRNVSIMPSDSWGGSGLLGLTIKFDSYHNAHHNLVRVLDVTKGGPADIAGLTPETDYILGTSDKVFKNPDVMNDELTNNIDKPMDIYVYSTLTDEVRVIVVLPSRNWGGEGCLGAEVGHGYLHTLPERCRKNTGRSVGGCNVPTNTQAVSYDAESAHLYALEGGMVPPVGDSDIDTQPLIQPLAVVWHLEPALDLLCTHPNGITIAIFTDIDISPTNPLFQQRPNDKGEDGTNSNQLQVFGPPIVQQVVTS